jgi:uncharacterized membrane-anchored protein
MATIRLPHSFRFIGPEGSRRLLTEAWRNPPQAAEGVLGMLIPSDVSPLASEGWGIVITYDEDGYVNDDDAASINYSKLLKQMQDATSASNEERQKLGFEPVTLVGWAEPPSYDAAAHKLYWAQELAFEALADLPSLNGTAVRAGVNVDWKQFPKAGNYIIPQRVRCR